MHVLIQGHCKFDEGKALTYLYSIALQDVTIDSSLLQSTLAHCKDSNFFEAGDFEPPFLGKSVHLDLSRIVKNSTCGNMFLSSVRTACVGMNLHAQGYLTGSKSNLLDPTFGVRLLTFVSWACIRYCWRLQTWNRNCLLSFYRQFFL